MRVKTRVVCGAPAIGVAGGAAVMLCLRVRGGRERRQPREQGDPGQVAVSGGEGARADF